jgi:cell division protein FtsQ
VRVRPVTVRGNAFGTPIVRQKSQRTARRAFYVTMDHAAGTEIRLPSLPMLRPGWRLLSALIAIAAMVGIYSMSSSDFFRLGGIEVSGLQRITPEEISGTIDLEEVSIIEVNTRELKDKLAMAYPELVDISVGVAMPNIITVSATERQPVVVWQKGDQSQWIDAEGVIFPTRGDAGPLVIIRSEEDLPMNIVVTDPLAEGAVADEETTDESGQPIPVTGPATVNTTLLAAAQGLSAKLPADTAILYTSRNGLGWTDPLGWQVYIGNDLNNFEEKFLMYQGLVQHFNEQGLQPVLVSVEHLDAPFYRLEP